MKIGELFIALGFQISNQKDLDAVEKGMERALGTASKLALGVNAINAAMLAMVDSAMRVAVELRNFGTTTGLSTDELQRWQQAAMVAGVDAKALTAAVVGLQDARNAFALGEPQNVGAWSVLGLDPTQDPFKVLDGLRARLAQTRDPGIMRALLGKVGMEGVMPVLQLPDAEFARFRREFVVSTTQIDRLGRLNREWAQLRINLAAIKNQLASAIAPALEVLASILAWVAGKVAAFTNWLNEGGLMAKVLVFALGLLAVGLLAVGAALAVVAGGLALATGALLAFELAASPILVPLALLSAAIVAIVAGIAFLVLILDDLWTAAAGGKSAFDWSLSLKIIDLMAKGIQKVIDQWDEAVRHFHEGTAIFEKLFGSLPAWMIGVRQTPPALDNLGQKGIDAEMNRTLRSLVQTNNVEINVDGSRSPAETGRAVAGSVRREISGAAYQAPVPQY